MVYTNEVIEFLRGDGKTASGYTLEDILLWDDDSWEFEHDFIQWLFPTNTVSSFNPEAPVLDSGSIEEIRGSFEIRNNLLSAYERFLGFIGVTRGPDGLEFCREDHALRTANHNWMRVGRVLRCFRLLGLDQSANELYGLISNLEDIDEWTREIWNRAYNLK